MRIIAIEEHITTPLHDGHRPDTPRRRISVGERGKRLGHDVIAELHDIAETRLRAMDEVGIDLQVLSLTQPGCQSLAAADAVAVATDANDRLYEAVKANPTRFAAFAALPTPDVGAAVRELERAIVKLGFKGAMINGHTNGEFLDDRKFWPIFEAAQALAVPIYLHPRDPHPAAAQVYFDKYEELSAAAWGFTMDTVSHFLRMVFGGVFDAFPRLQLALGHMGEGIPYFLHRLEDHTSLAAKRRGLKRTTAEVIHDNVSVTTSGNFSIAALLCAVQVLGVEKVIFSVDWPYESNRIAVDFLKHLPLGPDDLEKIAHGNVERLLKL